MPPPPSPPAKRKPRKYPQHIWLETNVFREILKLSEEMGVAPNVVCSEIIKRYLEGKKTVKVEVKEVVKEVLRFVCPFCLNKGFNGTAALRKHILEVHVDEIMRHVKDRLSECLGENRG